MDNYECDETKHVNDNIIDPSIKLINLSEIRFRNKTLEEWEHELTIIIPPLPTSTLTINRVVATLNNKYQIAYNSFNELQVLYSALNRTFNATKARVIDEKINELKGASARIPSKDILETISLNNKDVKLLDQEICKLIVIKDFFEYNKAKLEKIMQLVLNISYSASQADRMFNRTEGAGSGL